MHYIRFLKPPRLLPSSSPPSLTAKITVTTDLGESFLLANISLAVDLEFEDGTSVSGKGTGREYAWEGIDGMRSLEVVVPIPLPKGKRKLNGELVRMLVRPKEKEHAVDSFQKILDMQLKDDDLGFAGGIVSVRSTAININPASRDSTPGLGMAERIFFLGSGRNERRVHIWEETGESIARHIWDAGLVFSSYLATLSPAHPTSSSEFPKLPALQALLQKPNLNVLELGAGCGIVSITFASLGPLNSIHLTDLPEASEILTQNLSSSTLPSAIASKLSQQVLDWSSPLPPNVASTNWDLVLVADCTYNPDVVPDLVATLGRIVKGKRDGERETLVALAMKVRHESEMVFFELIREAGFEVREKGRIGVPVLGGEGEQIEIFVFRKG